MSKEDELVYSMPKKMFDKVYHEATKEYPITEKLIQHHSKDPWRGDIMVLLCEYYVILDSLLEELDKAKTTIKEAEESSEYYFSSLQATKVMVCLDTAEEHKQKLSEKNVSISIH